MQTLHASLSASPRRDAILARLGALLAELHADAAVHDEPLPDGDVVALVDATHANLSLGAAASTLYRERRLRDERLGGGLFGEPGWDMLLDLFAQGEEGEAVSVASLCKGGCVPPTTASRWLDLLVEQGLVEPAPDPYDGGRRLVRLTSGARRSVRGYLLEMLSRRAYDALAASIGTV